MWIKNNLWYKLNLKTWKIIYIDKLNIYNIKRFDDMLDDVLLCSFK